MPLIPLRELRVSPRGDGACPGRTRSGPASGVHSPHAWPTHVPYPRRVRRAAKIVTACVLAGGSLLAVAAPYVRPRDERRHLRVEVQSNAGPILEGGTVFLRVRATNEHPRRMRVYTTAVDFSESLGVIGRWGGFRPGEEPVWLPLARAWRVPFDEEIVPGQTREVVVRIHDAKAGVWRGHADVVLDGSTWARAPVEFTVVEKPESGSESGPGENP